MANPKINEIKSLFAEKIGVKSIDESKTLKELGIDSLDLAELSFELEDKYGVVIDPSSSSEIKTVADLFRKIEEKLA